MKILAWNCRGLARAPTIRTLRALIRIHRPEVIFLSETKIQPITFQLVLQRIGYPSCLNIPPIGLSGGLLLAWKFGVEIEPINQDANQISCLVYSNPSHNPWLISCIYAPYLPQRHAAFWEQLAGIGNSFGGSWLLLGDFNSILSPAEKSGGRPYGSFSHRLFEDFVHSNGLLDLGFNGNKFTWSNHRLGRANIRERLDRGLANHNWVHLFPNSLINHLPASNSDHCPLLLSTNGTYQNLPKPFRFEAFWTRDLSSYDVVAGAWLSEKDGSPAFSLSRKWKSTKSAFKVWNHQHFGKIQSQIKRLMNEIAQIQNLPHSLANAAKEQSLQEALQEQLLREEVLWKQKSRELWLTCTDLNTKFFHASTACRRRYNSISFLKTSDGSVLYSRDNIGNYMVDHYKNLFTTTAPVLDDSLNELIDAVVTEEDNSIICSIPDEVEIYQTIISLGLNKAPGPDGMTGLFYKTYWNIVKYQVVASVQSFFRGGYMLKEFNHTNIALIPKIDNPSQMNHFRPISLTNFNYKIISKILSNRFKPLLQKIISPTQSAFLKGRSIHDNTVLAHEIFHTMKHKQGNGGLMAIKLDIEKAFDSMEWDFLLKILRLLGFNSKWIGWIQQCITTTSFSILLDGSPFGLFHPTRGLRQGDPLSPFLFILGSEILSRLILKEELLGNLHGIKIARQSPPVSHLLFADDLMIFSKATDREANAIVHCLSTYSYWSGQKINRSKSSLFLSKNCRSSTISAMKSILNLTLIPSKAKYLGIPLFFHKSKKLTFVDIKNKILSKVSGWRAKLLSQAARTTLIKTVANSIPSYIMSIFLLPKGFCMELNAILRKFWWGFPQNKSHNLTLLAWDNICKPKSLGGLGIRSMDFMNHSLLARLGWKLTSKQPLLWVTALTSKYVKEGSDFLNTAFNPTSSWMWKGLMKARAVVEKGACLAISNGQHVNIWTSPWVPTCSSFRPNPNPNLVGLPDFHVDELIDPINRSWNVSLLHDLFDIDSVIQIQKIHIPQLVDNDRWIWTPAVSGQFSVKSAHEVVSLNSHNRTSPFSPEIWNCLWGLKLQHRLKHLLWKISWNLLPVRANIARFIHSEDPAAWVCPFCKDAQETISHVFLDCSFARSLWNSLSWPLISESLCNLPISEWISAILYPHQKLAIPIQEIRQFQLCVAITIDHIWYVRNQLVHNEVHPVLAKSLQHILIAMKHHNLAWADAKSSSLWSPPLPGNIKANFDVAVKSDFSVAAMVLSDSNGNIIQAITKRLSTTDAAIGEAQAALLAIQSAASFGVYSLILEGDAINIILAIQNPDLFKDWNFASIISDINFFLLSFHSWKASKISRSANVRAHLLARWAASNLVFGSIPNWSPILSSIRIKNGDNPSL
jgi:hypothetical protein